MKKFFLLAILAIVLPTTVEAADLSVPGTSTTTLTWENNDWVSVSEITQSKKIIIVGCPISLLLGSMLPPAEGLNVVEAPEEYDLRDENGNKILGMLFIH